MSVFKLQVLQQAYDDVEVIARQIARDSLQNADLFIDRALASFEGVVQFPESFALAFPGVRACGGVRRGLIHRQPNHVFYFHVVRHVTVVFRVADARRNDLAWLAQRP